MKVTLSNIELFLYRFLSSLQHSGKENTTRVRNLMALVQSVPLNSTKNYAKIFGRIRRGVKFRVAFNIASQWSVSRGNGQNKWVG